MKKYICPKCGSSHFEAPYHVTQTYQIAPVEEGIFLCLSCGYEAPGSEFVQEEKKQRKMNQSVLDLIEENEGVTITFGVDTMAEGFLELRAYLEREFPDAEAINVNTPDNIYRKIEIEAVDTVGEEDRRKIFGLFDLLGQMDHCLYVTACNIEERGTEPSLVCARDIRAEFDQYFEYLLAPDVAIRAETFFCPGDRDDMEDPVSDVTNMKVFDNGSGEPSVIDVVRNNSEVNLVFAIDTDDGCRRELEDYLVKEMGVSRFTGDELSLANEYSYTVYEIMHFLTKGDGIQKISGLLELLSQTDHCLYVFHNGEQGEGLPSRPVCAVDYRKERPQDEDFKNVVYPSISIRTTYGDLLEWGTDIPTIPEE